MSRAPAFDVRDEEEDAGAVAAAREQERLDRVVTQVRVDGDRVGEWRRGAVRLEERRRVGPAVEPMSPRFASAITSSPTSRAYAHTSSNARQPSRAERLEERDLRLHGRRRTVRPRRRSPCRSATTARTQPTRGRGPPRHATPSAAGRCAGSSPTTSWLRLRSTATARRSEKGDDVGWRAAAVRVAGAVARAVGRRSGHAAKAYARCPIAARMASVSSRHDAQLRRRSADERADESPASASSGCPTATSPRMTSATSVSTSSAPAPSGTRRLAAIRPPATATASRKPGSRAGTSRQTRSPRSRRSSRQPFDDAFERDDLVAEPRRFLVALLASEATETFSQRGQRSGGVVSLEPSRARAALCANAPTGERPVLGAIADDRPILRAAAQPDLAAAAAASIRGRTELANQAQLVERRFELGAGLAPLDSRQRAERCLDSRPLPPAREVRAEPSAQITGATDVEHDVVAIAEEVDAGTSSALRPRAQRFAVQRGEPRRGELDDVADRPRAALLREADERDEDLSRGPRVGERAMARLDVLVPKKLRERREADPRAPSREQPPREPDGVDHRRRDAAAREPLHLAVEERHVEAGVVRDEHRVIREREEASDGELDGWRAPERAGVDPGERLNRAGSGTRGLTSVLNVSSELERVDPLSADLADARRGRREPCRLEVEDASTSRPRSDVAVGRRASTTGRRATRDARRRRRRRRAAIARCAVGALASANSDRAACDAGIAPSPWTSSTRRSAASKESCTRRQSNRTYVRSQPDDDCRQRAEGPFRRRPSLPQRFLVRV